MEFVERRYQVASVIPLITHSFITALAEHHTQHKVSPLHSHTCVHTHAHTHTHTHITYTQTQASQQTLMTTSISLQELLVLSHTLSGDLDGCALRQLLLLAELVEMMPWNSLQEFSAFAAIIYPSLQVGSP